MSGSSQNAPEDPDLLLYHVPQHLPPLKMISGCVSSRDARGSTREISHLRTNGDEIDWNNAPKRSYVHLAFGIEVMSTLRQKLSCVGSCKMERRVDRASLRSCEMTTVYVGMRLADFSVSERLHRRLTNDRAPQL